ncbi:MAG: hypothetical protein OES32_11225 [Acidobacteriota bacterium]|nr:hypothetical protein [Acidobacteriota bacterium]
MRGRWLAGAALLGLSAMSAAAAATEVRYFEQQSRQDFAAGELHGLAIDAEGALKRARSFERVAEIEEPFVFAAVPAGDGWILGTGSSGRVLRVDPDGRVESLWTAPEPEIFALWADPDGAVFVGSSPNGKVYRLAAGGAEEVFDPQETYIWALARAPWGELLVATGDEGRLYAVAEDGAGRRVFDGDETHLRSLHPLQDTVLIGTAGDGLVQSIDAGGRLRTLFDADQPEVLAFADDGAGGWYAAAVDSEASFTRRGGSDDKDDDENGEEDDGEPVVEVSESPPRAEAGTRTAIVRGGSGDPRRVATLERDTAYSLARVDDALWIGTGVEGNVYSLAEDKLSLEASLDDRQVMAILPGPEPVLVTTNGAAVHRGGAPLAGPASYVSATLDAGAVSRFGTLSWHGEAADSGGLAFSARSGSSSEPDATWSDWSAPAGGSEVGLADVPAGRFLQWRLELAAGAGADVRVSSVELSYRQNNGEPAISEFTAMDPGQVLVPAAFNPGDQIYEPAHPNREGIFTTLSPAAESDGGRLKTLWRQGYRTLRWEAEDPNEDEMEYGLAFRVAGAEGDWLAMAEEIDESYYSFDATALPDGLYRFRLTASDRPGNAADAALAADRISEPVVIDHTPPRLAGVAARPGGLAVEIVDELSPIRSAELSVDAGSWEAVASADGLLDGRAETLEARVPAGARLVLLRVVDAAFNTATFNLGEEQ